MRVVDFTWAAAGPYCTLLLASMGAEVIKISSARGQGGFSKGRAAQVDRYLNYNKQHITVDLTTAEGADLVRDLVKVSDVVVENFRPGTMQRFGLHYDALAKLKPDLVMVSSSAFGQDGPQARYAGFAPIFATMSGLSDLTAHPQSIPTELRLTIDYGAGLNAAYAALLGLYYRRIKGRPQHIDLAARDSIVGLLGEAFLDASVNNREQTPMGNRDSIMAPHGVYPCRGEDAWISIAVATDEEWRGLCAAMGNPAWASEARFSDPYLRWQGQDELDASLGQWTRDFTPMELMELLQGKGVAAVPSFSIGELFEDPHLRSRGFSTRVEAPSGEGYTVIPAPWLMDGQRLPVRRHGPQPGEDNHLVLEGLLGLSAEEVERLGNQGILH